MTGLRWSAGSLGNTLAFSGVPNGNRTRVSTLKGWCPRPLDDGDDAQSDNRFAPGYQALRTNDDALTGSGHWILTGFTVGPSGKPTSRAEIGTPEISCTSFRRIASAKSSKSWAVMMKAPVPPITLCR